MHINLAEIELTTLISVIITIIGLVINYIAYRRNMRKDAESSAAANARLLAEVQTIKENVMGMRDQIKELNNQLRKYGERLVAVETKVDRASVRIDKLEDRLNKEG